MQVEPKQYLRLDLEISVPSNVVFQGLNAWFEWELISEVDFRWRNSRVLDNRLTVIACQNEAMLRGLDLWLNLGLLSDKQVRLIGENRFVCMLKAKATETEIAPNNLSNNSPNPEPVLRPTSLSGSRQTRSPSLQTAVSQSKTSQETSKVAQTLRSLFSEFSTMWLLFLGVFLVVVSSGLLAASQWDNFSSQVQYLLLLAYTLGFFGVSLWTSKNDRLRLTTRALQLVTLLLVPANFWAMDGLGLLKNPAGIGVSAIAGCLLSGIAIFLLQTSFVSQETQIASQENKPKKYLSQISILAILFLSWLHLGWFLSSYYPLIAVYLGVSGIATSTFLNRQQRLNTVDSSTFPLALITGVYSTILLTSRALLFGNVSILKLGLAFGICGWVLLQITNKAERLRSRLKTPSEPLTKNSSANNLSTNNLSNPSFQAGLGRILLGLGWLISVGDQYPWQTLTISLLIAWLLCERLWKLKEPIDLTYLFFWGLQTLWLVQRLISEDWKALINQQLLIFFQTNSQANLFGVLLFPYLILTLFIASVYRDRHKHDLANRGELLALGFGVLLTTLSIGYPTPIFANLTFSALALLVIQAKRSPTSKDLTSLIYFAHIITLSAISSGLFLFTRSTSIFTWIGFLLVTMLLEWSAVLIVGKYRLSSEEGDRSIHWQVWRDCAWHIGADLAAFSYILLWNSSILGRNSDINNELLGNTSYWSVAWLSVPISLTFLGTWRTFADRDLAIKLSIAGLAIAQFLTWHGDGSRLIGLGVAFALMLVNTRHSKSLFTAFNTVGYGLLFIAALLWQFKFGNGAIAQLTFGINGVIASVMLLYVLNHWLKYRRDHDVPNLNLSLNQSYSQAFDIWSVILSAALLILQTYLASTVFAFNQDRQLFINLLPSTILVTLGLVYRIWQSFDQRTESAYPVWTEWGMAWSIELLVAGAVAVTNGSLIELAIANFMLGFVTQLLGDWLINRRGSTEYPRRWDIIPLIYGVIGSLLRIGIFTNLSGLFLLSTSLIGIGIGRRASQSKPIFKTLIYLSMVGVTFSAYELLFYQMVANSKGDSLGDGMVILAILGCAIAYAYKIFSNWIVPYLRLSIREIDGSANLHWIASAVFLLLGSFFTPSASGGVIGGGVAIALSAYAIAEGKRAANIWIYAGLSYALAAISYLLFFAFPNPWLITNLLQPYAATIACIFAAFLYLLPWQKWGWAEEPWHNSAFALPLIFTFITANAIASLCLLSVGIFYTIYAKLQNRIQITYITVLLFDWAIFQNVSSSLYEVLRFDLLIYVTVIGFSGLYFAQVEPTLRSPNNRSAQHSLRSLLSGGMGLIAYLYSLNNISIALYTWGLTFIFIMAGLGLRVRAYLFMGTLTFILLVLTQAVTLVTQYSFLMWALGIVAGIGFILVAANFEVRRDRILALFRNVAIELETWE